MQRCRPTTEASPPARAPAARAQSPDRATGWVDLPPGRMRAASARRPCRAERATRAVRAAASRLLDLAHDLDGLAAHCRVQIAAVLSRQLAQLEVELQIVELAQLGVASDDQGGFRRLHLPR